MQSGPVEQARTFSELFQHLYFWVVVVIGGIAGFIYKHRGRFRSPFSSVEDFVSSKTSGDRASLIRYVGSLRCVIVDDKPEDFPLEFMRGFFAAVSVETRVSLNDAKRLASFDVIFLDVANVVEEDRRHGGAILIDRIRQLGFQGIMIGVSSKKYDVEVTKYFELADIRIRKPVTAAAVEEQVLAHASSRSGPVALAKKLDEALIRVGGTKAAKRVAKAMPQLLSGPRSATAPKEIGRTGLTREFKLLLNELRRLRGAD